MKLTEKQKLIRGLKATRTHLKKLSNYLQHGWITEQTLKEDNQWIKEDLKKRKGWDIKDSDLPSTAEEIETKFKELSDNIDLLESLPD